MAHEEDLQNLRKQSIRLGNAIEAKKQQTFISAIVAAIKGIRQPTPQVTVNIPKIDVPKAEIKVEIPEIKVPEATVKVEMPDIKVPDVTIPPINVPTPRVNVTVPAIKIPPIKVPRPEVTVNVAPAKAPIVNVEAPVVNIPEVIFPETMRVLQVDEGGKPVRQVVGVGGGGGGRTLAPKEKVIGANIQGSATVGTASTEILGKNDDRHEFTITNDSDAVIYLAYGRKAVIGDTIRLSAEGGTRTDAIYTGSIFAISASADKNVTILEL